MIKDQFHFPKNKQGEAYTYLCGHSLGLQHNKSEAYVAEEMKLWQEHAVEGHFTGKYPWLSYHERVSELSAPIVGASTEEVIVMNSLTANLQLMLASFYQPEGSKNKILIEENVFPSDLFAVQSHLELRGYKEDLVFFPAPNGIVDEASLLERIEKDKDQLALVYLNPVSYLSGKVLDLTEIAKLCQEHNIKIGLDLAHTAGNIPIKLHDLGIDFAVWCNYKYLNGGPGAVGAAFVHKKHLGEQTFKLKGWWGTKESTRFKMEPEFQDAGTAEAWQLSNAPILSMASLRASLEAYYAFNMEYIRAKGNELVGFLRDGLSIFPSIEMITPEGSGNMLSFFFNARVSDKDLKAKGVILDQRNYEGKNLFRASLNPLYNTKEDAEKLLHCISKLA